MDFLKKANKQVSKQLYGKKDKKDKKDKKKKKEGANHVHQPGWVPPSQCPLMGWYAQYYTALSQQDIFNLKLWFDAVDTDKGGTIDPFELANLSFDGTPLGLPAAIRLIKVFDRDNNGCIDFYEYCALHRFVMVVRNAFIQADTNRTGTLEGPEIVQALINSGFGYLNDQSIMELINRYDPQRQGIRINDFILIAAHVGHIRSIFEWNDIDRDGILNLNLNQFNTLVSHLA